MKKQTAAVAKRDDKQSTRAFTTVEQVTTHYFPQKRAERPRHDGGQKGAEVAEKILSEIANDLR